MGACDSPKRQDDATFDTTTRLTTFGSRFRETGFYLNVLWGYTSGAHDPASYIKVEDTDYISTMINSSNNLATQFTNSTLVFLTASTTLQQRSTRRRSRATNNSTETTFWITRLSR